MLLQFHDGRRTDEHMGQCDLVPFLRAKKVKVPIPLGLNIKINPGSYNELVNEIEILLEWPICIGEVAEGFGWVSSLYLLLKGL